MENQHNGAEQPKAAPGMPPQQVQLITALNEMLNQAAAGNVASVAVFLMTKDGRGLTTDMTTGGMASIIMHSQVCRTALNLGQKIDREEAQNRARQQQEAQQAEADELAGKLQELNEQAFGDKSDAPEEGQGVEQADSPKSE